MDNLGKLTTEMGAPSFPDSQQGKEAIQRRLAPRNHPVWRAIVKLYGLPWFRRVWILKEVAPLRRLCPIWRPCPDLDRVG